MVSVLGCTVEFTYYKAKLTIIFLGLIKNSQKSALSLSHQNTVLIPEPNIGVQMKSLPFFAARLVLYGYITRSPRACHYDTPRRAHYSFPTRCIGWRMNKRTDHHISYLDTLMKTGRESIGAIVRRRRILFAGFVARMGDTRLSKCVMFGELMGATHCVEGQEKEWRGVSSG